MQSSASKATNLWSGIVGLDKPTDWTSRQAVDRVVKLVRPAKAGHAGTLDPLATGVLLVAIGPATRLITHLQRGRKRYVGTFRLGQRSNTDDIQGDVVDVGDCSQVTREQILGLLEEFMGVTQQVPPQYSAVHVDGQRAYSLARKGESVELAARDVEVFSIQLTRFELPEIELDIECGSGTYIRSIGRDLGERLGCGAIMTALKRIRVGPFVIQDSLPAESLSEQTLQEFLKPPLFAVQDLPRRTIDSNEITAIRQGKTLRWSDFEVSSAGVSEASHSHVVEVALVDSSENLVAVAEWDFRKTVMQPRIVMPS